LSIHWDLLYFKEQTVCN